jgi:hypothetical protein
MACQLAGNSPILPLEANLQSAKSNEAAVLRLVNVAELADDGMQKLQTGFFQQGMGNKLNL